MPRVKETLAGRYELTDVLGRGGMGVVYRATDRVLGRTVAVKILPAEHAEDRTFVERFEREARAAAALSHPSIVAVFDSGFDADTRFIVMECVPGSSLAELLRREGALPSDRAAEIAAAVADALAAAHRAHIIHRDVKPANVMVDDRAKVKVLDFGIARAAADSSLTRTAIVLGSAPYLAPEVVRGEPADQRSDIYSLGCLLYEMLTGRPPFTGELPAAIMHQHDTVPPRPPAELNPNVPAALEALTMRMLAKRPERRPQSAGEVAQALLELSQTTQRAGPVAAAAAPHLPPTAPTNVLGARRPTFGRGERIGLAVAALLVLAGVALALALSSGGSAHRAARSTNRPQATKRSQASTTRSAAAASKPLTVRSAAAALTAATTAALQAHTLDQRAAAQILGGIQDAMSSYGRGDPRGALAKLEHLGSGVSDLAAHRDIQPGALPAIDTAIANLRLALARAAAATPQPQPPRPQPQPQPTPPAKHGKGHGGHGSDGGG